MFIFDNGNEKNKGDYSLSIFYLLSHQVLRVCRRQNKKLCVLIYRTIIY